MISIRNKIATALALALAALLALAPAAHALYARLPGASIKSIQSISQAISHTAGTFTDNTTITSVDLTRALLFVRSEIGGNAAAPFGATGAHITSATNVAWDTYVTGAGTYAETFGADVVEFSDQFKSIQWVQGGAATRTISAVNTAKTVVLSCNVNGYPTGNVHTASLSNSTTVAITNGADATAVAQWWCVIEFY